MTMSTGGSRPQRPAVPPAPLAHQGLPCYVYPQGIADENVMNQKGKKKKASRKPHHPPQSRCRDGWVRPPPSQPRRPDDPAILVAVPQRTRVAAPLAPD